MKPTPSKPSTPTQPAPPSAPATLVHKPPSPITARPAVQVDNSHPATTSPSEQAPVQTSTSAPATAGKAKSTISISVSKPQPKLTPPPLVPPKPRSPINLGQSITNKPPSPVLQPPTVIGKPISSLPMYVPAATARVTPPSQSTSTLTTSTPSVTTVTISPPVVVVQSVTPVLQGGDSRIVPSGRITPSGRATPSGRRTPLGKPGEGSLRQGVPQKPYTFMDEKARYKHQQRKSNNC